MTPSTPSAAPALLRTALVPLSGLWSEMDRFGPGRFTAALARLALRARAAARRARARRQLLALDDRMLKDIGYVRSDVLWYAARLRIDPDLQDRGPAARR